MSDQPKQAQGLRWKLIPDDATRTNRLKHIRGEARSLATQLANADNEGPPDVVALSTPLPDAELAKLAKERRRYLRGKRGRPPMPIAEIVMWGPPRHAAENAWPREKSKAWADDTLAWIKRHFPDSPVVASSMHMDEGSPHCHFALFPRYTDATGETAYGWKRAHSAAAHRLTGKGTQRNSRRQRIRDREEVGEHTSLLLDDYHATVGAKYGLARGVKGSQRRNKAVEVDESSRRHAEDREAKLDVRERKLEAEREEITAQRQAVKADFDEKADTLLEAQKSLNEREAQLDADAKRKDAEYNRRELALRHVERDHAEAKAALAGKLRRLDELEEYQRKVAPVVAANRKAKEAKARADRESERQRRFLEEETARAEAEEEERELEREAADEAERRKKAKAKVVPARSWFGRSGKDRGLGR